MISEAVSHAQQAANLSPWNYRTIYLLGSLQEIGGNSDEAEKSLRSAARLAPNNTEVNWALANLLMRRGKLTESLDPFRSATRANEDLLPMAFELIWQSSRRDLVALKVLAGTDASAQLSLVQFLLDQSLSTEALDIFRKIDRGSKISSVKSSDFMSALIGAGQYESARVLWLDLVVSSNEANSQSGGLVWNGGFELASVERFNHFDWILAPSQYARIGIDTGVARSGARSLKVAFVGRDTTILNGEIRQLVVLRPGRHYRLEGYAKAGDLVTPEGPRLAIMGPDGVIVTSDPVVEGATDWQRLVIDFNGPDDSSARYIGVIRIPKFSYDDPTRGAVWFDDFTLTELSQTARSEH